LSSKHFPFATNSLSVQGTWHSVLLVQLLGMSLLGTHKLFPYLDVSEVAEDQVVSMDTGRPLQYILLMFWYQSRPVLLQACVCVCVCVSACVR